LILKKHYKNGIGMPIKSAGPLDETSVDRINEEKPDLVVILDKAVVKQEFIDKVNCKVLIIDHHPLLKLENVKYFNPLKNDKKSYVPTSNMAYAVTKDNMWLAVIGCLFDYSCPDFLKEFKKEYPDMIKKLTKDAGYIVFETELGKLVKLFAFNLKGKRADVKNSVEAMENVNSPYEIMHQTTKEGKYLWERYEKLNREYEDLLKKAESNLDMKSKFILFMHPQSRNSFVMNIATELSYWHQDKTIIIGREKENEIKISLRNQKKDIRKPFAKALEGLKGYGGGHPHAVGGSVSREDFEIFIGRIYKLIK